MNQRYNPHRHFFWLLAGITILSAIILSIILSFFMEQNILEETVQVTREGIAVHFEEVFSNLFSQNQEDTYHNNYYSSHDPNTYNRQNKVVSMHFDLYRIEETKFIQPDGKVYFSYNPNEIDQDLSTDEAFSKALNKEVVSNHSDSSHLQIWIPILDKKGEVKQIAFVNRNITTEIQSIRHLQGSGTLIIFIIFIALYFSLSKVFIRSTQEIKQRNQELQHLLQKIENTYDSSLQALSTLLDARDNETEGHSMRVTAYTMYLSKKMGIAEEEYIHIARGALLHDIGKIGIPDHILRKPGPLTNEEWKMMRTHVDIGADMLEPIDFLNKSLDIIKFHHERWDGSGYPNKLKGKNIPIGARIFALCDTYDAITSDRPYRRGRTHEEAVAEIATCSGSQFDPEVVNTFLAIPKEEWIKLNSIQEQNIKSFSLHNLLAV